MMPSKTQGMVCCRKSQTTICTAFVKPKQPKRTKPRWGKKNHPSGSGQRNPVRGKPEGRKKKRRKESSLAELSLQNHKEPREGSDPFKALHLTIWWFPCARSELAVSGMDQSCFLRDAFQKTGPQSKRESKWEDLSGTTAKTGPQTKTESQWKMCCQVFHCRPIWVWVKTKSKKGNRRV